VSTTVTKDLQDALIATVNFKTALKETISVNNKLTDATLQLAEATGNGYGKELIKIEALEKRRLKLLKDLNATYKKTDGSIKYNARNLTSLKGAYDNTTVAINKQKKALDNLDNANKKAGNSSINLSSLIKKGGAIMAALASVQFAKDVIKNVVSLTAKFESLDLTLKMVSKSMGESTVITGFLEDISSRYGLEIVSLTERFLNFKAAADQSNYTLADTMQIYDSITKAGSVMGKTQYEIEGSLLAIEQMMSKGKITTEELRRQLGERLPGAMGIMAKAAGVSLVQLDKMLKSGELLSAEMLPKFVKTMEEAYGIENVNNIDTLTAAQNRLSNSWKLFVKGVGEGGGALSGTLKGIYWLMERTLTFFSSYQSKLNNMKEKQALETFETYGEGFKTKNLQDLSLIKNQADLKKARENNILILEKEIKLEERKIKAQKQAIEDKQEMIDEDNRQVRTITSEGSTGGSTKYWDKKYDAIKKMSIEGLHKGLGKQEGRLTALEDLLKVYGEVLFSPDEDEESGSGSGSGKDKKPSPFNKADLNEYNAMMIAIYKDELGYVTKIAEDKDKDIKSRLDAYQRLYELMYEINRLETENEITKNTLKYEEDKLNVENSEKGAFKSEEDKKQYLKDLEAKHLKDIELLNYNHYTYIQNLKADTLLKGVNAVKESLDVEMNMEKNKIEASQSIEMTALNEKYKAGLIKKEEYEKEKQKIENEYLKKSLQKELEYAKLLLDKLIKSGADAPAVQIIKTKIEEINEAISKIGLPDENKEKVYDWEAYWNEVLDVTVRIVGEIGNIVDNMYQQNIDSLEAYKDKVMDFYEQEIQAAEGNAYQQDVLRKEKEAKEKEINKKIRAEKIKQAKMEKAFAMFQIGVDTARAVVNGLKTDVPFPFPLIIAALYGALGVAQLAVVASKPIPTYKHGTMHHKGGLAVVGDGGKAEVVAEPNKQPFLTPSRDTLMYLDKGARVYPSFEDYKKSSINASIMLNKQQLKLNKEDVIDLAILNEVNKTMQKGFKGVKHNIIINQSFGYQNYKNANTQF
jgi:tape measure domain-containing protein